MNYLVFMLNITILLHNRTS